MKKQTILIVALTTLVISVTNAKEKEAVQTISDWEVVKDEQLTKEEFERFFSYLSKDHPNKIESTLNIIYQWSNKALKNSGKKDRVEAQKEGKVTISWAELDNLWFHLYKPYYLAYPNSMITVEGYLLKKERRIAELEYQLAEIKYKQKEITLDEFNKSKNKWINADAKCKEFLKSKSWHD